MGAPASRAAFLTPVISHVARGATGLASARASEGEAARAIGAWPSIRSIEVNTRGVAVSSSAASGCAASASRCGPYFCPLIDGVYGPRRRTHQYRLGEPLQVLAALSFAAILRSECREQLIWLLPEARFHRHPLVRDDDGVNGMFTAQFLERIVELLRPANPGEPTPRPASSSVPGAGACRRLASKPAAADT